MDEMTITALAVLFILSQVLVFYKVFDYRCAVDRKNAQLIQFYLDTKFVQKILADSLNTKKLKIFCDNFILDVKEYYNLEGWILGTSATGGRKHF